MVNRRSYSASHCVLEADDMEKLVTAPANTWVITRWNRIGQSDLASLSSSGPAYDALATTVPDLRTKSLLPGAGHWIQQERPADVNELLLAFLRGL